MTRPCLALSVLLCSLGSLLLIAPARGQRSSCCSSLAGPLVTHFAGMFEDAREYSDLDDNEYSYSRDEAPSCSNIEKNGSAPCAAPDAAENEASATATVAIDCLYPPYASIPDATVTPPDCQTDPSNQNQTRTACRNQTRTAHSTPLGRETAVMRRNRPSGTKLETLLSHHDPVYDAAVYGVVSKSEVATSDADLAAFAAWTAWGSHHVGVATHGLVALLVAQRPDSQKIAQLVNCLFPAEQPAEQTTKLPALANRAFRLPSTACESIGAGVRPIVPVQLKDARRELLLEAADALDGVGAAASLAAEQLRNWSY